MTSPITTHILNLQTGSPAVDVAVELVSPEDVCYVACTNDDGRIISWSQDIIVTPGKWTLVFAIEKWFTSRQENTFYSDIAISFRVEDIEQHYHVPLLLSAYGYSTYRGS